MADVTIAIPTFRRPHGLERLLGAIQNLETDASVRVLVADNDAERQEGLAVVERLMATGYRWPIEVFVVKQRGIAQTRNALVARAIAGRFDWLAMLDDDEWPDASWMDAFLRVAAETGADALHGAVIPEFEKAPGRWAARCHGFAPLRNPTGHIAMIHGSGNALLSRSALATLAPPWFDPRFALSGGEDKDFFTRLRNAGARFAWADDAVVQTAMPATRVSVRWAVQRAFRIGNSDMRVFLKHTHGVSARLIESAKIVGAIVMSPPLALLAVPVAEWRILPICKFARAAGKLWAALGLRYDEYAVTHGH